MPPQDVTLATRCLPLTPRQRVFFIKKIHTWYLDHEQPYPWRIDFKHSEDPYFVLVSEIMLQQTTIKSVLPVYERFIEQFPNIYALAQSSEEEVLQACRGLGYYRRFRNLYKVAQILAQHRPARWPQDFEAWKKLPGIGSYTAAALSSICLNQPKAVIDGNVERIICRLNEIKNVKSSTKTRRDLQAELDELIALSPKPSIFNQGLMELGQKICTVHQPSCPSCPIKNYCKAFHHKSQNQFPSTLVKRPLEKKEMAVLICIKNDAIALQQRPPQNTFLSQTLGFPIESSSHKIIKKHRILGHFKHRITHHDIHATVYNVNDLPHASNVVWQKSSKIADKLMTSFDQKAWQIFLEKNL